MHVYLYQLLIALSASLPFPAFVLERHRYACEERRMKLANSSQRLHMQFTEMAATPSVKICRARGIVRYKYPWRDPRIL